MNNKEFLEDISKFKVPEPLRSPYECPRCGQRTFRMPTTRREYGYTMLSLESDGDVRDSWFDDTDNETDWDGVWECNNCGNHDLPSTLTDYLDSEV